MTRSDLEQGVSSRFDFQANVGSQITLVGSVQNVRELSWGGFLILRLPNYLVQVVLNHATTGPGPHKIPVESTVRVDGTIKTVTLKDKALNPRGVEIEATAVEIISVPAVEAVPLDTTKRELNAAFDTVLDLRPLSLRHPKQRAIFRIQSAVFDHFGSYLVQNGFTRICSPKLVFSGAEGGANVFSLDYFGKTAYLAQSPQFYKQMMVGVFGRVFEEAPVFRAEKHNTSRHLNEYISLDLEMQLDRTYIEIMQLEANLIASLIQHLRNSCEGELELLEVELPSLAFLTTVEFNEAHEIVLQESGKDHRTEDDLAPEEEKILCEYAKREWNADFVFVTHYPSSKRPFYAMDDPERPELTLSFDLLFRGLEITTGGQRMHRYEDYVSKMRSRGMDTTEYESYLQTFRYGMPPHGGLGFGLERFTAKLCGLDNIKACSLFPRDIERLTP